MIHYIVSRYYFQLIEMLCDIFEHIQVKKKNKIKYNNFLSLSVNSL